MTCSPARLEANRRNARHSTGPRTDEGKARSRGNAVKHGMTGEGIALPTEDAAAVEARFAALEGEMRPSGELARFLVRRVALLTVRIERAALQETAALAERVREAVDQLDDDLVAIGASSALDPALVERARAEAGARASFDPSPEATLARRYEAASERALFRTLRELREVEGSAPDPAPHDLPATIADPMPLASFGPGDEGDPEPGEEVASVPAGPAGGPPIAPAGGFVWGVNASDDPEVADIDALPVPVVARRKGSGARSISGSVRDRDRPHLLT